MSTDGGYESAREELEDAETALHSNRSVRFSAVDEEGGGAPPPTNGHAENGKEGSLMESGDSNGTMNDDSEQLRDEIDKKEFVSIVRPKLGKGCAARIFRKWPRTFSCCIGILLPLWSLVLISILFGMILGHLEHGGELDANDEAMKLQATSQFYNEALKETMAALPTLCYLMFQNFTLTYDLSQEDIDAQFADEEAAFNTTAAEEAFNTTSSPTVANFTVADVDVGNFSFFAADQSNATNRFLTESQTNQTEITPTEAILNLTQNLTIQEQIYSRFYEILEKHDDLPTYIYGRRGELSGNVNVNMSEFSYFMDVCGDIGNIFSDYIRKSFGLEENEGGGDTSFSFNWNRCVNNSDPKKFNRKFLPSNKDIAKAQHEEQARVYEEIWYQRQRELYLTYRDEFLASGNTTIIDARIRALQLSVEEATARDKCSENIAAASTCIVLYCIVQSKERFWWTNPDIGTVVFLNLRVFVKNHAIAYIYCFEFDFLLFFCRLVLVHDHDHGGIWKSSTVQSRR
jgi:hypothetical protein